MDPTKSSATEGPKNVEAGTFELKAGELLKLRVFVDKSFVEVFANDGRQAVLWRNYPSRADSVGVKFFSTGSPVSVAALEGWKMMPSNPY